MANAERLQHILLKQSIIFFTSWRLEIPKCCALAMTSFIIGERDTPNCGRDISDWVSRAGTSIWDLTWRHQFRRATAYLSSSVSIRILSCDWIQTLSNRFSDCWRVALNFSSFVKSPAVIRRIFVSSRQRRKQSVSFNLKWAAQHTFVQNYIRQIVCLVFRDINFQTFRRAEDNARWFVLNII